jgi:ribosomal protein S18 acetylase RimI-like enzyme
MISSSKMEFYVEKVVDFRSVNLDKCVSWMYDWWGKEENWSKEKVYAYMKASFNDKLLPMTIIAFNENKEEIGMCHVTMRDLDCRPDIYPYIANLYIDKKYRNKGICKYILDAAIKEAKCIGLDRLYIYTEHVGLYEKYGWEFIGNVETYLISHIQRLYLYDLKQNKSDIN